MQVQSVKLVKPGLWAEYIVDESNDLPYLRGAHHGTLIYGCLAYVYKLLGNGTNLRAEKLIEHLMERVAYYFCRLIMKYDLHEKNANSFRRLARVFDGMGMVAQSRRVSSAVEQIQARLDVIATDLGVEVLGGLVRTAFPLEYRGVLEATAMKGVVYDEQRLLPNTVTALRAINPRHQEHYATRERDPTLAPQPLPTPARVFTHRVRHAPAPQHGSDAGKWERATQHMAPVPAPQTGGSIALASGAAVSVMDFDADAWVANLATVQAAPIAVIAAPVVAAVQAPAQPTTVAAPLTSAPAVARPQTFLLLRKAASKSVASYDACLDDADDC